MKGAVRSDVLAAQADAAAASLKETAPRLLILPEAEGQRHYRGCYAAGGFGQRQGRIGHQVVEVVAGGVAVALFGNQMLLSVGPDLVSPGLLLCGTCRYMSTLLLAVSRVETMGIPCC